MGLTTSIKPGVIVNVIAAAVILTGWPTMARAGAIELGLTFLNSSQNEEAGTWGDAAGSLHRDSTVVLETYQLFGMRGSAYSRGIAGAAELNARNNDDRARLVPVLKYAGRDVSALIAALLTSQSAEIFDPAQRDFPGYGWGIAAGFGNSTLDTALALRALQADGLRGVISVVNENLTAFGASPSRPFTVPAGATDFLLKVRDVSGGTVRFLVQQPGGGVLFVDISPQQAPANIAIPVSAGDWAIWVENQSGTAASYTADLAFTDASGFNRFRISSALLYLGLAQNPDGGWGLAPGEDSHLMVTSEVVRALAGAGNAFAPDQTLLAAAGWLLGLQNADGGFSTEPNSSNINETSLAVVAVALANPGANLESAAEYLRGLQQANGSWTDDPYLTAIALQALRGTGQDITPLIFGDGFEP